MVRPFSVFDGGSLARFEQILANPAQMAQIRQALHFSHPGIARLDDRQVLALYMSQLRHHNMVPDAVPPGSSLGKRAPAATPAAAPAARSPSPATGSYAPVSNPVPAGIAATPAPVSEEKTWIEIELLGEDDQPIAGERYVIELSNGIQFTGTLDAKGLARVEGLQPDTCKVSFPDLDREAWSPIS